MPVFKLTKKDDKHVELDDSSSEVKEEGNEVDDKDVRMITLDGPLGNVYTQALNEEYALEGMDMMLIDDDEVSEDIDNEYIYADVGDDMDVDKASEIIHKVRIALDDSKNSKVRVKLSKIKKPTSSLQMLDDFCRGCDVKLEFTV